MHGAFGAWLIVLRAFRVDRSGSSGLSSPGLPAFNRMTSLCKLQATAGLADVPTSQWLEEALPTTRLV